MKKRDKNKLIFNNSYKKKVARLVLMVAVFVGTTFGAALVYAAFTEPAVGPASSDQDFTLNILGANNNNNDFDSSAVVANEDGSMIERLEYIIDYLGG
ncbi:MAG: hypothetical protein U9P50_01570 [Patescibacteria group bacterium]|nr:hypothetical protein [Patescibacteria group bacterium]